MRLSVLSLLASGASLELTGAMRAGTSTARPCLLCLSLLEREVGEGSDRRASPVNDRPTTPRHLSGSALAASRLRAQDAYFKEYAFDIARPP
uniref:Predicted protein n=1 Tax=Hordeum vulgare subsp. vulgare TaxID=112509 RepID=F2D8R5_HORVV|nr:predicted protein [Hordeum vulgare subsp. vulgare]